MIPQTNWAVAPEENIPAIDAVLNHQPDPDAKGVLRAHKSWLLSSDETLGKEPADLGRDDFEYYVSPARIHFAIGHDSVSTMYTDCAKIKWQGKAHFHATWEKNESLTSLRGIRRLENYFRKVVLEDIHMTYDEDIPPEEKEKWNLDRERDADALKDYIKVDRVIGMQEGDEGETEYLVKCESSYLHLRAKVLTSLKGRDSTTIRAPGRMATSSARRRRMR